MEAGGSSRPACPTGDLGCQGGCIIKEVQEEKEIRDRTVRGLQERSVGQGMCHQIDDLP